LVGHTDITFLKTDGTSASTPVVAALLTLLNDYQLSQARSPLGFVNHLLYSVAKSNPEAYFGTSKKEM
jgi:subtilase family serine protease